MKETIRTWATEISTSGICGEIGVGVCWMIDERFAVDASIRCMGAATTGKGEIKSRPNRTEYDVDLTMSSVGFLIGASYVF